MTYELSSKPKIPKRYRPKPATPTAITAAMDAYNAAYKRVFGVRTSLSYDGVYVRIAGQTQGVSRKRLDEMTRQLINRIG